MKGEPTCVDKNITTAETGEASLAVASTDHLLRINFGNNCPDIHSSESSFHRALNPARTGNN